MKGCKRAVAQNLNFILKERGVSKAELARKSGISETTVKNYAYGRINPRAFNLLCIADALNVSMDWLVGRTNCREVNK